MKIYSYVVARDFGFAPNPYYGYCTLATCKPVIRRLANVGDWIVGTGAAKYALTGRLVYIMRVTETLSFNQYWLDPRFREKRPNLRGSFKQNFGDNIYHRNGRAWIQENSHHSLETGARNIANIENDTQADRVLISDCFTYWGGNGLKVPASFRSQRLNICAGRGHKSRFSDKQLERIVAWLMSLAGRGCVGMPEEFKSTRRLLARR